MEEDVLRHCVATNGRRKGTVEGDKHRFEQQSFEEDGNMR